MARISYRTVRHCAQLHGADVSQTSAYVRVLTSSGPQARLAVLGWMPGELAAGVMAKLISS